MTCSARSLGSRWSCSARTWSSRRRRAARPGPGDRVGREAVALDLEEELRARPDDLEGRGPDEEQVRAGVDPAERAVEADPVEWCGRCRSGRQVERLAPGEDDLDRLAGGDRVLGDLDRVDVVVAPEARLDPGLGDRGGPRSPGAADRRPRRGRRSRRRWGGRSARGPRRSPARRSGSGPRGRAPRCGARRSPLSVWVRWSKTRTRSVSMNAASRDADRIAVGERDGGLERRDRVVGQGADGAAGEAGHALGRQDPAARRRTRGGRSSGSGRRERLDRQVRGVGRRR